MVEALLLAGVALVGFAVGELSARRRLRKRLRTAQRTTAALRKHLNEMADLVALAAPKGSDHDQRFELNHRPFVHDMAGKLNGVAGWCACDECKLYRMGIGEPREGDDTVGRRCGDSGCDREANHDGPHRSQTWWP